jgi:hypothetical protein
MGNDAITPDRLLGTWKLVSARAVDRDGKPGRLPFGPEPMGRLVLSESGRMMAVLCDGRLSVPAGEKRAYSSYCGQFRVEGDTLITKVDLALLPERLGGEQRRKLDFRDGKLVLMPPPEPEGEQRELFWERTGPA